MRRLLAAFLLLCCTGASAQIMSPPGGTGALYAGAYNDLIANFWTGSSSSGKWQTDQGLWPWALGSLVLYDYYQATGATDATTRIAAEWTYIKATYTAPQLIQCGSATTIYGGNLAQDDTAWNVMGFLVYYAVTGDAAALTAAKGSIDCANATWLDNVCGGGLYYSVAETAKTIYQAQFALDEYWYYQLSGDATYRTNAINLDTWIANELGRFPGSFGSYGGVLTDGLYWASISTPGCSYSSEMQTSVPGNGGPYRIVEGSSAVMLEGNMAEGVLLARLYNDPLTSPSAKAAYLQRLVLGSQGIKNYEEGYGSLGDMTCGGGYCVGPACSDWQSYDRHQVFIDDEDGNVTGVAAYAYAKEVLPLVADSNGVVLGSDFRRTANVIRFQDRFTNGTYGASWNGPNTNSQCWIAGDLTPALPSTLATSAQTVNMLFAGATQAP